MWSEGPPGVTETFSPTGLEMTSQDPGTDAWVVQW